MQGITDLKVLFIAGFGPIVRETEGSRKLYGGVLGIPFKEENGGYLHTESVPDAKSLLCGRFLKWRSRVSATNPGARDLPAPQAWLESDVDRVEDATASLESAGYRMVVQHKKE